MRVWIINPFDNLPFEGYRPQRFWLMAEAFAMAGYETTFWTADFSHTTKMRRKIDTQASLPFDVLLVHEPAYQKNVSVARFYAHYRWAKNWTKMAQDCEPPDLIIHSSPPLAIGSEVRKYARKVGARIVLDVMDAWPENFERVFPHFILSPLRFIARKNYLAASVITVVATRYADLVRSYGYKNDVRLFYHGINLPPAKVRSCRANLPLRLVYAGNMGRTYALEAVIMAVARMENTTLDLAGDGDRLELLKALAKSFNAVSRIRFHGYLSQEALDRLLDECDIGIVPMDDSSCVGVPYKFGDYSAHSLAIISSLAGESSDLLARYGAGEFYEPGDVSSLVKAVERISQHLVVAQANSRRLAEAEFDADSIYQKYVKFAIENIVEKGR